MTRKPPAKSATKPEWAEHALAAGLTQEEVDSYTKDELVQLVGDIEVDDNGATSMAGEATDDAGTDSGIEDKIDQVLATSESEENEATAENAQAERPVRTLARARQYARDMGWPVGRQRWRNTQEGTYELTVNDELTLRVEFVEGEWVMTSDVPEAPANEAEETEEQAEEPVQQSV